MGGYERPEPRSLGLLPSGPDPVGEWLVHRQPPAAYIGRGGGESKLRPPSACKRYGAKRHYSIAAILSTSASTNNYCSISRSALSVSLSP